MKKIKLIFIIISVITFLEFLNAQEISTTHTRGKLWETLYNYGFIGDPGAWDYLQVTGIGFFPGFSGYTFPNDEFQANGFITDANFHNFRTGPWIIAKDAQTLVAPAFTPEQRDYLVYHSSLATGDMNVQTNISPFRKTENYVEDPSYDPLFPEEVNYTVYHTGTGVTVKQRSMAWSFPGYDDFIIYDYIYKNEGKIALPSVNRVDDLVQTMNEVWIVFHSGIQVSTKGNLNFYYDSDFLSSTAPAGGFGWHPGGGYTDYYAVENDNADGKGLLFYSRDYNGGKEPPSWVQHGKKSNWRDLLRVRPEWEPELQDPSAFGFVFLYRTPPTNSNGDPFEADPTYFNIYSDEGDKFNGKTVDFEGFGLSSFSAEEIYQFATHNKRPSNSGRLYNWYTSSFGPYTLAPGDSVRIILAEVAGVMDLWDVIKGDPNGNYPDSTIADIRRNAEAARNAINWGIGAKINGIDLAADVPDSPPAPFCSASNASKGSDTAVIAIRWEKLAEETQYIDGSGNLFFDGSTDLDGYRIFRGIDKRGIWELVADIPRIDFDKYWDEELGMYQYEDKGLQFGFEFYYYVQAYNKNPNQWTSANGTVVDNLPELVSSDKNRTPLTTAKPGPINLANEGWDVFVAPNPFIEGDPNHSFGEPTPYKIEFRNLPERATIKIFSISGDLVATIEHEPDSQGNLSGSASWNQRSESGLLVAPGLYIYVVQSKTENSSGEKTNGKFMIIR